MKLGLGVRLLAAATLCLTVAGSFPTTASANIYVVTNTNNSGAGSLRQAITEANANPGFDSIEFNISGCIGACLIQPTTSLPTISDPLFIDGLSQSGASAGNLWAGVPHTLKIELDGSLLSSGSIGLRITAGGSTVQGLILHDFPYYGIYIDTAGSNTIRTNYIGTDEYGVGDLGNGQSGIALENISSNLIGGSGIGDGNLISGNDNYGILIEGAAAASNQVKGNFIGTDVDGTQRISNGASGILLDGAPWNTIGGPNTDDHNLVSGNVGYGVLISGSDSFFNSVQGNYIGTARHGNYSPLEVGNGLDGVRIAGSHQNTIGGDGAGEGNLVSGNAGSGVAISGSASQSNEILGNLIGTDKVGTASIPNGGNGILILNDASYTSIGGDGAGEGNLISGNDGTGISINDSGTSYNAVQGNLIGTDGTGAAALANGGHGVRIRAMANNNTIGGDSASERNVISGNDLSGVQITNLGSDYNLVKGNYIGTNSSGTAALPNGNDGVVIDSGARWNSVGGTNPGEGNLISGNAWSGVSIYGNNSDSNYVFGNLIGTDAAGSADLGNGYVGVFIGFAADSNTVGGASAAHRNVISGNNQDGVKLQGADTSNNEVMGNYIGLAPDGETALGNALDGVIIFESASNNTIGGDGAGEGNVIAANGSCGVAIWGAGTISNTVSGNLLGTDKDGAVAHPNGLHGVFIGFSATGNLIGGTTAAERNLISGNSQDGVRIENTGTSNNTVEGNYIGTTASGLAALHNTGSGVSLRDGAQNNTIGGDVPAERNLISGNWGSGVWIRGASTSGNTISGNHIGVDPYGTAKLGNSGYGVQIDTAAHNNIIGGTASGRANIIGGNVEGIHIDGAGTDGNTVSGNFIGTDRTGTIDLGHFPLAGIMITNGASDNTVGSGNTIAFNATEGIRIYGATTTDNDVTRNRIYQNGTKGILLASGANGGIAAPVITMTSLATMSVSGTTCSSCVVEVFANPDTDGEGRIFLGSTTATGGGAYALTVGGIPAPYLTATATDASDGTSEFSAVFTSTFGSSYLPLIMR